MEAKDDDGEGNDVTEIYLDGLSNLKREIKVEPDDDLENNVFELYVDDISSLKKEIKKEIIAHDGEGDHIEEHSTVDHDSSTNFQPLQADRTSPELEKVGDSISHGDQEAMHIKPEAESGEFNDDDDDDAEEHIQEPKQKFQVDRSAIPEVAKSDQASELQGLEGLSVYNQETLEAGILKQVDDALTGGKEIVEASDENCENEKESDYSLIDIGRRAETSLIDIGRREETEMERSIRLGEMTPFGTTLLDQNSKRKETADKTNLKGVIEGLEKYFRNQEKLTKKQNTRKREAKPDKNRPSPKKAKQSCSKDLLQQKVSNRDQKKKKKIKKKEKLGTNLIDGNNDNDGTPGTVCGEENYFYNNCTDSEYLPSSEEGYSSDDYKDSMDPKSVTKSTAKRGEGRKRRRTYKLPGNKLPEDWRSDDSDWESSDEEYKRKLKHSKKELDDGDIDLYRHRLMEWEKENERSAEDFLDLDEDQYHEFDSGFKIPLDIWDKLYNYQRVGVRWMWELDRQCCGGILGDEMGLGKTIQMIAFLAGLHCSQMKDKDTGYRGLGPTLIVCPTTVMHQWVKEMHKWFPIQRIAVLHESGTYTGKNKEDMVQKLYRSQRGILVLSYTGAVHFKEMLTTRRWHYVILDEGHKIRNPDAQVTLVLKQLTTSHRLLLTGSPMQNNLKELWSLFDFIFPGKLGTLPVFMAEFAVPITQGGYANASEIQVVTAFKCATVLRDTISPFLLRRMKSDVQSGVGLPDKNEQVLFCRLSDEQRALYKGYVQSDQVERILHGHMQIFVGLIALRKICNHPDLYTGGPKLYQGETDDKLPESERYGHWSRAGKMIVVETLLKLWKKQNHRVLLFTQGCQMLSILEEFVKNSGYKYLKLDGSTSIAARQPLIDKFNQDTSYFVMVLTTRVGGLGVNLVGANRVVIFDPDWNPATDTQARERAWRIGQRQPVTIYRLITAGTIEEKMYHRQIFKQFLSNKVLKDPRQRRFFKSNDLFELFTLKETETEGSTETSAIFAGTDSEVKLDPNKRYRSSKPEIKPREMAEEPALTFSKKKIEYMKKLAQKLSLKLTEKNSKQPVQDGDPKNVAKTSVVDSNSNLNETSNNTNDSPIPEVNVNRSVNSSCNEELIVIKKEVVEEALIPTLSSSPASSSKQCKDENTVQEKKTKHRKHKKHKKHKKFKDIEFEGETVPHLVQHETSSGHKTENEEGKNLATQDEYVLKKLFDKSGLQTAMKHDSIMEGGPSDYAIVECEADKVAKEAVEALKKSRRECWRASAGVPTFTGQNGAIRHSSETRSRFGPKKPLKPGSGASSSSSGVCALTMSSADLINHIRERNLMKLPEDSDLRLLNDIREFILANGGTALTDQLISKFQSRLPADKSPVFKSLLSKISVFYRAPDKKGYWTLRDEFVW